MALPTALYTAEQVRELDKRAIASGVSGFELMTRAAQVSFGALLDQWPACRSLIILAGTGNNGGDGNVLAAIARQQGMRVIVLQCGDAAGLKGEALLALQLAQKHSVQAAVFSTETFQNETNHSNAQETVLVDALLGTGAHGALREPFAAAVNCVNNSGFPVLALDVPSGLCATTGHVVHDAVRAHLTVSFIALKQGLLTGKGPLHVGRILFHDLDIGSSASAEMTPASRRIDIQSIARLFTKRKADTHKGNCGHVVVVGGELGYGGAAIMCAESATRCGAGTVSLVTRGAHVGAALARRPELMVLGVNDAVNTLQDEPALDGLLQRASVIAIGPGLGRTLWSRQLLQRVLQENNAGTPLVVDADALNLLSENEARAEGEKLKGGSKRRERWILTPHPGEAARMLGCSTEEVQADRFAAVKKLQTLYGGVCLLKGAGSLLCYQVRGEQQIDLCTEGNPGMASGGMGDVLSGIIAAFVAQEFGLSDSLRAGVCVHGESADLAAENGERGLLATDLLPRLRELINRQD